MIFTFSLPFHALLECFSMIVIIDTTLKVNNKAGFIVGKKEKDNTLSLCHLTPEVISIN